MTGFILNIISSVLKWIFQPFLFISCCCIAIYKREFNKYNMNLAISKDQYGNVLGKYIFDIVFIKSSGYKFGNVDETISSVIGKNKLSGTLTLTGRILDFVLNTLDENHSIESIENDA